MYHSPIQLDVFPTDVQMRRIDPARNMRRFYRLSVQRDLFGRASLVREWGRIGFRGQTMVETHPEEGRAIPTLMSLAAVKKRRGSSLATAVRARSADRATPEPPARHQRLAPSSSPGPEQFPAHAQAWRLPRRQRWRISAHREKESFGLSYCRGLRGG
ncbi:MAG: WGR domain-containing protein [Halothiobacillaceae bacterium]